MKIEPILIKNITPVCYNLFDEYERTFVNVVNDAPRECANIYHLLPPFLSELSKDIELLY